MPRSRSGQWIHVNTDIFSLFQFSLLSMISFYVCLFFVFGDKPPCFCNESLTGGLCYLIPFGCGNNNVLFTAAMGQICPLCLKSTMIKAGWCIAAALCVSGDNDNSSHILSEDNVLMLRDNKGMQPLQPHCPIIVTWSVLLQLRRQHRVLTQLPKHLAFRKQGKQSVLGHCNYINSWFPH